MSSEPLFSARQVAAILRDFEDYLADREAWSSRKMKAFRRRFRVYGIEGADAHELKASAAQHIARWTV